VLAAEAPDIDVVAEFGGRVFGFANHRGITHTLVGIPAVAALVVLAVWALWRMRLRRSCKTDPIPPRWGVLFGLACLSGLVHILLDFTNNYGVRPFMPFLNEWFSWDIVFIYEPIMWGVLLIGLLAPVLFSLVDREIGARKPRSRGRFGAAFALVFIIVLWGVRDYQHRRAVSAMQALTYQGQDALRLSAYPYPGNIFKWYGVVETPGFFERMIVDSSTPEVDPQGVATVRYKSEETPVTEAAKSSYLGRVYLDWAQYPITEVEQLSPPESGYVVRFYDLRYMYPDSTRKFLGGWVQLNANLNVVAQSFGVRNGGRDQARTEQGAAHRMD
jgi:inner membrane protein